MVQTFPVIIFIPFSLVILCKSSNFSAFSNLSSIRFPYSPAWVRHITENLHSLPSLSDIDSVHVARQIIFRKLQKWSFCYRYFGEDVD